MWVGQFGLEDELEVFVEVDLFVSYPYHCALWWLWRGGCGVVVVAVVVEAVVWWWLEVVGVVGVVVVKVVVVI